MKNEKIRENGCKIFCIYFNGMVKNKGEKHLKEIAKIGETENIHNSNSLMKLVDVFNKIADIIKTNYQLQLNKKI